VDRNGGWKDTLVVVTGDHECGYLTGPGSGLVGGKPVWKPLVNNGKGNLPGMQWNSGSHTNALIPFYAKGKGAGLLRARARGIDPVRGRYLDNSDLAEVMLFLLR
jgi:alkaline phosphatase